MHRSKGKKYASLPSEDAQIAIDSLKCRGFGSSEYGNMTRSRHKRNSPRHGLGNGHRRSDPVYNDSEVSYNYEPERAYSDGPYSSEECGSDAEQPPPTAYVSQKQEGGTTFYVSTYMYTLYLTSNLSPQIQPFVPL